MLCKAVDDVAIVLQLLTVAMSDGSQSDAVLQ